MALFIKSTLLAPHKLQKPFQALSQEILDMDLKGDLSADSEIDLLCQKVHEFARSAINFPISRFQERGTEEDFDSTFSVTPSFRTTMQNWDRLSSIAPLTSENDQLLRSRYLIASLRFHQRLAQYDPVSQALVRLHQRRLSLPIIAPINSRHQVASSTSLLSTTSTSLFAFNPMKDFSLVDAYNRVQQLFSSCNAVPSPFLFSEYWDLYSKNLTVEEQSRFLTALLYRFYLHDIDIPSIKVSTTVHPMEVFCWQTLAENISEDALLHLLDQLSLDQNARLATLAFAHYREGSFFLVNALVRAGDPNLIALIRICQREQRDCISIAKQLQSLSIIDPSNLNMFIEKQEAALIEKAVGLANRMHKLLPLILNLSETRKKGCHMLMKQYGATEISSEEKDRIDSQFFEEANAISSLFFPFQAASSASEICLGFDQTDFQRLLRTFGSSHLVLPSGFGIASQLPFLEGLDALINVYSNPLSSYKVQSSALNAQLYYLSNLLSHVQALRSPSSYAEGASTTIFSLSTCGKELSRLSWLPSMAENLSAFCASTRSNIQDHPIFVFDQSPPPLFLRNLEYINQLNLRYGTRITVYSNEQILELSNRLNLGQLIDTTKKEKLGYGGARNAVYMLSPMLKKLDKEGLRTPEAVLSLSTNHLRKVFLQTLSSNQWTIHMGDDDAQIPYAYFLSDLLLAEKHHGSSFVKCGEFLGRDTSYINGIHFDELFDLEKILAAPEILFGQTFWTKDKRRSGMCGALRSFGWSILPFGSEETYNAEKLQIGPDIRPSGFHLAGRRFPSTPLPSSPIIGIANRLKSYLPYLLETILVVDLIEPSNKTQRTILPWKQRGASVPTFDNLGSALTTLSSATTEKAMRKQLLKNYWEQHYHPTLLSLFRSLSLIANHDINGSISNYLHIHPKASHAELEELEQCRIVFEEFQEDSEAFFLFNRTFFSQFPASSDSDSDAWINEAVEQHIPWKLLLSACKEKVESDLGKPLSNFPITSSLLLMLETIIGGELQESVRSALQPEQEFEHHAKRTCQGLQESLDRL
ncbi:MAG: hypothetical protein JSR93_10390 [Verrucomicrobia bacterium]|nr:hypothetical protein [Verrucomicrobiota bacterium]